MNSIRYTVLAFGLAIGVMSHSASAQQDWSRFIPPPVKVAPVPPPASSPKRTSVAEQDRSVLQASHVETRTQPDLGFEVMQWESPSFGQPSGVTRPPAHRVIQAPLPARPSSRHRHVPGASSLHHGPILPELPGVENDPKSAGPGHLGLGTHWVRDRASLHPPIPGATVAPRWKAPYAYGHFGAEGKRGWTRQYGYRDRYLQWSLR